MLPLIVALVGGAFSIGLAFWLQALYQGNQAFQIVLNDSFRLSEVAGAEVLVLPLAFVFGQFVQLITLLAVSRRAFGVSYRPLIKLFVQASAAGLVGAVSSYVTLAFVVDGINQDTFIGIMLQGLSAGIMGLIGIVLTYLAMDSSEIKEIYRSFHTRILKTDKQIPQK